MKPKRLYLNICRHLPQFNRPLYKYILKIQKQNYMKIREIQLCNRCLIYKTWNYKSNIYMNNKIVLTNEFY